MIANVGRAAHHGDHRKSSLNCYPAVCKPDIRVSQMGVRTRRLHHKLSVFAFPFGPSKGVLGHESCASTCQTFQTRVRLSGTSGVLTQIILASSAREDATRTGRAKLMMNQASRTLRRPHENIKLERTEKAMSSSKICWTQ